MSKKYVKQADTWHVVDSEAKPTPATVKIDGIERRDGRPSLRAKCGQLVHTGAFDEPIDDGDHCTACAGA